MPLSGNICNRLEIKKSKQITREDFTKFDTLIKSHILTGTNRVIFSYESRNQSQFWFKSILSGLDKFSYLKPKS